MMEDIMDPDARDAAMRAVNPAYIPRNHLVEAALDAAVSRQDFARSSNGWKSCRTRLKRGRATSASPRRLLQRNVCNRLSAGHNVGGGPPWALDNAQAVTGLDG
jgi:uncharacterized protein YdiU (UPF0061 family)